MAKKKKKSQKNTIADAQQKEQDSARQMAEETIRRCLAEGVLTSFLENNKQEVVDIMVRNSGHP